MDISDWVPEMIDEIKKTPVALEFLHRAAVKGQVLVGYVLNANGLTEWYMVSPGQNSLCTWEPKALEFFMAHDLTESVIVGVQVLHCPLILFAVSRLDVPSLQFSNRSLLARRRLVNAEQKRQRRAQRNSIAANG